MPLDNTFDPSQYRQVGTIDDPPKATAFDPSQYRQVGTIDDPPSQPSSSAAPAASAFDPSQYKQVGTINDPPPPPVPAAPAAASVPAVPEAPAAPSPVPAVPVAPQSLAEAIAGAGMSDVPPPTAPYAGGSLRAGVEGLRQIGPAVGLNAAQRQLDTMARIDRGEQVNPNDDPLGYSAMSPEQRAQVRTQLPQTQAQNLGDIVTSVQRQQAVPTDPGVTAFQQAQGWGPTMSALGNAPVAVLQDMVLRQLPALVPMAAATAIGGPGAGIAAGVVGTGPSAFAGNLVKTMQAQGVDVNNSDQRTTWVAQNGPLIKALYDQAMNVAAATTVAQVGPFEAARLLPITSTPARVATGVGIGAGSGAAAPVVESQITGEPVTPQAVISSALPGAAFGAGGAGAHAEPRVTGEPVRPGEVKAPAPAEPPKAETSGAPAPPEPPPAPPVARAPIVPEVPPPAATDRPSPPPTPEPPVAREPPVAPPVPEPVIPGAAEAPGQRPAPVEPEALSGRETPTAPVPSPQPEPVDTSAAGRSFPPEERPVPPGAEPSVEQGSQDQPGRVGGDTEQAQPISQGREPSVDAPVGGQPEPIPTDTRQPTEAPTHVWRSAHYDFPVTPTGEEATHTDGTVYAKVRLPDGTENFVPKAELSPLPGAEPQVASTASQLSLEPVHSRTLQPLPSKSDLTQAGSHTFSIKNSAGESIGTVDTVWNPDTGNLHIADFQSNEGPRSLGPAVVRQIRDQLVARYPGVKTLSGQRITGAISAERRSGSGPGREAVQTVRDQAQLSPEEQATRAQLEQSLPKLRDTIERLESRAPTSPQDVRKLANARQQLVAAEEALGRYQPKAKPTITKVPGAPKGFRDYKLSDGTSVYLKSFSDAGHDPANAVNYPINRQVNILKGHAQDTFGFKDVTLGKDKLPIDAREQLLDTNRAIYDMTGTLGFSSDFASLKGKLNLSLDAPLVKKGSETFGLYDPNTKTIHVMGRANSFGHEWIHALDHDLAEKMMTLPPTARVHLLSQYTRAGVLGPHSPMEARVAKLINTLFFDQGDQAAKKIDLQYKAGKTNKEGKPTLEAIRAQQELDQLERGAATKGAASEFRRRSESFSPSQRKYFGSEAELLARSGEAYIAHEMTKNGVDPRGVVMPDEAYLNEVDRTLKELYPKAQDRTDIFQAWRDTFDGLRAEGWFGTPERALSGDYGVVDPRGWERAAGHDKQGLSLVRPLKASVANIKNWRARWREIAPFDPDRPESDRTLRQRVAMGAKEITYSRLGWMDEIIKSAPDAAKPYLDQLREKLGARRGTGIYTPEGFEEEARNHSRIQLHKASAAFAREGLLETMKPLENDMLYEHMHTGSNSYMDGNKLIPIPANIKRVSQDLRQILNEEYHYNRNAGINLQYVQDKDPATGVAYVPHVYDHAAVHSDPRGFARAAESVYKDVWNRDVPHTDPVEHANTIVERWDNLAGTDKEKADAQRLRPQITELKQQLRALTQGTSEPSVIRQNIEGLVNKLHDSLGDFVARQAANDWVSRIDIGYPGDYDKVGPSGNYLNGRELPGNAYEKLKPWMVTDVKSLVGRYIEQSGRKVAYTKRFGIDGGEIERLLTAADEAARTDPSGDGRGFQDAADMRHIIKSITGRTNNSNSRTLSGLSNFVNAWASTVTMPRAVLSSLNEPAIAAALHKDPRAAFKTLSNVIGQWAHTADGYDRTELADWLGTTASRMSESIMMSRTNAEFHDSPRIDRFMQGFWRANGLSAWTNSVRAASTAMNHGMLQKFARDLLSDTKGTRWDNKRDDALRMFNEMGVPPQYRTSFAEWLLKQDGLPSIDTLKDDPMQPIYSLALRRLVDWSSPDPYKGDRPILQDHPWLRTAWAWQAFNGAFARSVLNPVMDEVEHAAKRAYGRERAAGSGKAYSFIKGTGATAGAAAWAASGMATLVGASLLSTIPRQYFFAHDDWEKHHKDGTLGEWLWDLGVNRSGLNGMLDPVMQIYTGLKYRADVSQLLEGGPIGWLTENVANLLLPAAQETTPNTNTRANNAVKAGYNLIGAPAISAGLTAIASVGGPAIAAPAAIAMMYATTAEAAQHIADWVTGPKGNTPATRPMTSTQRMEAREKAREGRSVPGKTAVPHEQGPGAAGAVPVSFLDDIAQPLWKVVRPLVGALPGAAKVGAAVAGGAYEGYRLLKEMAPYRHPPPEKATAP